MSRIKSYNNVPLVDWLRIVGKVKRREILSKIKNDIRKAVTLGDQWRLGLRQLFSNSIVVLQLSDIKKSGRVAKLSENSSKNNELLGNTLDECTEKECGASSKSSPPEEPIGSQVLELLDEQVGIDLDVAITNRKAVIKFNSLSPKKQECESSPITSKMSEKQIDEKDDAVVTEIEKKVDPILVRIVDEEDSKDADTCMNVANESCIKFSAPDETEIVVTSPFFGIAPLQITPKKSGFKSPVQTSTLQKNKETSLRTETMSIKCISSKDSTANQEKSSVKSDRSLEKRRLSSGSSSSEKRRDSMDQISNSGKSYSGEKLSKKDKLSEKSLLNTSSSLHESIEHSPKESSSKSEKLNEKSSKSSLTSSGKSRMKKLKSTEKCSFSSSHNKSEQGCEKSSMTVKDSIEKENGLGDLLTKQDVLKKVFPKVLENNSKIPSLTPEDSENSTNPLLKRLKESPYTTADKSKSYREKEERRHSKEAEKNNKLVRDDPGENPPKKRHDSSRGSSSERNKKHTHHDRGSTSSKRSRDSSSESCRHRSRDSDRISEIVESSITSSSRNRSSLKTSVSSPEKKYSDDYRVPTRIGSSKKPRISRIASGSKDSESQISSHGVSSLSPQSLKDEILARTIEKNKKRELRQFSKKFKTESPSKILKRKRKEFEKSNKGSHPPSELESDLEEGEIATSHKIRKLRESCDSGVSCSGNVNSQRVHESAETMLTSDDSSLESHDPCDTLENRLSDIGAECVNEKSEKSMKYPSEKVKKDEIISSQSGNKGNPIIYESIESILAGTNSLESNEKIAKSASFSLKKEKKDEKIYSNKPENEDNKKMKELSPSIRTSLDSSLESQDAGKKLHSKSDHKEVDSTHEETEKLKKKLENGKKSEIISTESKKDNTSGDYLQRRKNLLHRDMIELSEKERLTKEQGDFFTLPPHKKTKKCEKLSMPSLHEVSLKPAEDLSTLNKAVPVPEYILQNLEQQINTEIAAPNEILPLVKDTGIISHAPRTKIITTSTVTVKNDLDKNREREESFSRLENNSEISEKNFLKSELSHGISAFEPVTSGVDSTTHNNQLRIPLLNGEGIAKDAISKADQKKLSTQNIAEVSKSIEINSLSTEKLQAQLNLVTQVRRALDHDEAKNIDKSRKTLEKIPNMKVGTIRVRNFEDLGKKSPPRSGGVSQIPSITDNLRPLPYSNDMNVREANRAASQIVEDLAFYFNLIFWCRDSSNTNTVESLCLNQSANRIGFLIVKYFEILAQKKDEMDWAILAESVMEVMKRKALPYQTQVTEIMDIVMEFSKNGFFLKERNRAPTIFPTPVPSPNIPLQNGRVPWFELSQQQQAGTMPHWSGGSDHRLDTRASAPEPSHNLSSVSEPPGKQDGPTNHHPMPPLGPIDQAGPTLPRSYSPSSERSHSSCSQKSTPQQDARPSQIRVSESFKDVVRQSNQLSERVNSSINPQQASQPPPPSYQQIQPQPPPPPSYQQIQPQPPPPPPPAIAPQKYRDPRQRASENPNINIPVASQRPVGPSGLNPVLNNTSTMQQLSTSASYRPQMPPNWQQNYQPIQQTTQSTMVPESPVIYYPNSILPNSQMLNPTNNFTGRYYPNLATGQNTAASQQGLLPTLLNYQTYQAVPGYQHGGQMLSSRPSLPPGYCPNGPNCHECRANFTAMMSYPLQPNQNPRQINPSNQNLSGYQSQTVLGNPSQTVLQMKQNNSGYQQVPPYSVAQNVYSNVSNYQETISQDVRRTIPAMQVNPSTASKQQTIPSHLSSQINRNIVRLPLNVPPMSLPNNNQPKVASTQQKVPLMIQRDNVNSFNYPNAVGPQQNSSCMNTNGMPPEIARNSSQYLQQKSPNSWNPQFMIPSANNSEIQFRNNQQMPVNYVPSQQNFSPQMQLLCAQGGPLTTTASLTEKPTSSSSIMTQSSNLQGFSSLVSAIKNPLQGVPQKILPPTPKQVEQSTPTNQKNSPPVTSTIRAPIAAVPSHQSLVPKGSINTSIGLRTEPALERNFPRAELSQDNSKQQQSVLHSQASQNHGVEKLLASNHRKETLINATSEIGEKAPHLSSEVNILKAIQQLSEPEVTDLLESPKTLKVRRKMVSPKKPVKKAEEFEGFNAEKALLETIETNDKRSTPPCQDESPQITGEPAKLDRNRSCSVVEDSPNEPMDLGKDNFSSHNKDSSPIPKYSGNFGMDAESESSKASSRSQYFKRIVDETPDCRKQSEEVEVAKSGTQNLISPQSEPIDLSSNRPDNIASIPTDTSAPNPIETPRLTLVISGTCSISNYSNSLSDDESKTGTAGNLGSLPGSPESIDEPEVFGDYTVEKCPESCDKSFESKMKQTTDFDIPSITEFRKSIVSPAKVRQDENDFDVPSIAEAKRIAEKPMGVQKHEEYFEPYRHISHKRSVENRNLQEVPSITELKEIAENFEKMQRHSKPDRCIAESESVKNSQIEEDLSSIETSKIAESSKKDYEDEAAMLGSNRYTFNNARVQNVQQYNDDSNSTVEEIEDEQLPPSALSQSIIDEEIECARLYPTLSLQEPEESGFVIQAVETISQTQHDAMSLGSDEMNLQQTPTYEEKVKPQFCSFCHIREISVSYGDSEKVYCSKECLEHDWNKEHCEESEEKSANIKEETQPKDIEIIELSDSDDERIPEEKIQKTKPSDDIILIDVEDDD